MGIATEQIVGEFKDKEHDSRNYCICPICLDVLEDPATLAKCEHNFCRRCIECHIVSLRAGQDLKCPECRALFTTDDVNPPPRLLRSMLSDIRIKCDFETCGLVVGYWDYEGHMKDCLLNPAVKVPCVYCGEEVFRSTMEDHKKSCPYLTV